MNRLLRTLMFSGCLFILIIPALNGQNNPYGKVKGDTLYSTGWSFGLNLGAYWASKYQGNFYNGAPGNIDSINLIFGNKYYVDQIKAALNGTFHNVQLPEAMHYQPAMLIGFTIKYNMKYNLGILISCNYQSLKAKDVVTLSLGPAGVSSFDSILQCPIWGKEDRMNIDLGLSKDFVLDDGINYFLEGGMNINYVKVKEHKMAIANQEYSLINIYGNQAYVPNTQLQEYNVRLGGWGMGAFVNTGFRFVFNNHISLDPGATFYWSQIKLKGYTAFRPQWAVFVRLSYQQLVDRGKFYD